MTQTVPQPKFPVPIVNPILVVVALLAATSVAPARADSTARKCSVADTIAASGSSKSMLSWLSDALVTGSDCSSVKGVVNMMVNTRKRAGRELESDRPLDVAAAEKELTKAEADAEFRSEVAKDLALETHPLRQQVVRAAWLHEFGYFKARDLVLQRVLAASTGSSQ